MEDKVCLQCNQKFTGRLDKKFCTDQCRASYHNSERRNHEKTIVETNQVLRRNRTILKKLNPIGKTTVRIQHLKEYDFDFGFFTNIYKTSSGNIYYCCYEYAYMLLEGKEKAVIINRQNYMNNWTPV
ncbi:hypothetical protein RCC89_03565 [Cytophagaceae bacterium ABcell3]|nr:hypothetical protein RCC89_03565 [Cytophagaceae bacterium ABcell3]